MLKLVGGLEHFSFFRILGMSSSQLTHIGVHPYQHIDLPVPFTARCCCQPSLHSRGNLPLPCSKKVNVVFLCWAAKRGIPCLASKKLTSIPYMNPIYKWIIYMCIYIYIYIHIFTYVHVHMSTYTYTHTYTCTCTYTYTYKYAYTYTNTFM